MGQPLRDSDWKFMRDKIKKVLDRGGMALTKTDLAKLAQITYKRTCEVLKRNPELEEQRIETVKAMTDKAVGNLGKILDDPLHKDHWQASKHILTKYKTELDEDLEARESIGVDVDDDEDGPRVTISFGPQS